MILGIDYSMSSPSLCFMREANGSSFKLSSIHYLTSKKKYEGSFDNMVGDPFPVHEGTAKFDAISNWVMGWVNYYSWEGPVKVYLEDYAFGATGRVFHIAENTGLLKYKLWKAGLTVNTIAPTSLKKFASGRGNAKKEDMEVAFFSETGYNVKEVLKMTEKQWNPSSDIIDSYYICKYGFTQEIDTNGQEQESRS